MIHLKFFAKYREWLGVPDETLDVVPVTLGELKSVLVFRFQEADRMLADPGCVVAINRIVVRDEQTTLKSGDEVAFYPPVTGG